MIPIRVPFDAPIHTTGGPRDLVPEHPLYGKPCPVCDRLLGARPVTFVYVGSDPKDRQEAGWICGAGVAVHVRCTGTEKP